MERLTPEEIYTIFPNEYGGNAQISDLRLLLSKLVKGGVFESATEFNRVNTLSDMQNLEATQGDICLVEHGTLNEPETYIYDNDQWKIMVIVNTGGGSSYQKLTEQFLVSQLDEDYQELTLQQSPVLSEHIFVFLNGILLKEGSSEEFTITGNTIYFNNVILNGDEVTVKYSY